MLGPLDPATCEKQNGVGSFNITQTALDLAIDKAGESGDFIIVCGEHISNTKVPNGESAIEAICVKPSTDKGKALQAARQLTALVLNCAITDPSTADAYCENTPFEELFNACNAACATANNHVVTATVGGHDGELRRGDRLRQQRAFLRSSDWDLLGGQRLSRRDCHVCG